LITLLPTVVLVALTAALSAVASAQTAASGSPGPAMHESKSMGNVAKQLNNPVADLWALTGKALFQKNPIATGEFGDVYLLCHWFIPPHDP